MQDDERDPRQGIEPPWIATEPEGEQITAPGEQNHPSREQGPSLSELGTVRLVLSEQVVAYLNQSVNTGLYGSSLKECCENLVCRQLEHMAVRRVIDLRRGRRR